MEFKLSILVLSFALASVISGYPDNSREEDERRGYPFPRRMIQEQRRFLNDKFAEVLDSFDSMLTAQLGHIINVVESIERRQSKY